MNAERDNIRGGKNRENEEEVQMRNTAEGKDRRGVEENPGKVGKNSLEEPEGRATRRGAEEEEGREEVRSCEAVLRSAAKSHTDCTYSNLGLRAAEHTLTRSS